MLGGNTAPADKGGLTKPGARVLFLCAVLVLDRERSGGGPGSPAGKEQEPEQTPAVSIEGFSPAPSRKFEHQGLAPIKRNPKHCCLHT